MIWYNIIGGPRKIWALCDATIEEGSNPESWGKTMLGFIEREHDGSWNCFNPFFCGNEPSVYFAKRKLWSEILKSNTK